MISHIFLVLQHMRQQKEVSMERNDLHPNEELIPLGSITEETKGVSNLPRIDSQGNLGGGGLSDD
jgi:hypothetical protein